MINGATKLKSPEVIQNKSNQWESDFSFLSLKCKAQGISILHLFDKFTCEKARELLKIPKVKGIVNQYSKKYQGVYHSIEL